MTAARPLIVCAAGGTGGHVFPAQAVAAAVAARGGRPVLFTDRRGGDFGRDVEVERVSGGGVHGLGPAARAAGIARLGLGLLEAVVKLRRRKPDVVVGFGGYASLPTVVAAMLLGAPTVIHEQNAVLGRANRLLARRVGRIASAFAELETPPGAADRVVEVGMPVRAPFVLARERAYAPPRADEPVRILALGGSQGAQVFSTLIPAAIALLPTALRARLLIAQQCRPETLEATAAAYRALGVAPDLAPFFSDVPDRLAMAHLVICRSGASTVAELLAVGRPAILVPYPFAIDDHQTANARALDRAGAGWLAPQAALEPEGLAARIAAAFDRPETLARAAAAARAMGATDAADRLLDVALALIRTRPGASTLACLGGPL